ncbi:hypothetical protein GCM10023093_30730 [Nemorincola caseinilytica]|uniref:BIG2 domain-containing protein n=2 Tax=Nemorincola caseinilytica TaxID=2054315 RepID=A0ABP8NNB1_9BACT
MLMLLLCIGTAASGAVSITSGTGGGNICSNKAVTGVAPAFTNLGPIVITEGLNTDLSVGTNTLVLYPPAGWQFSTTLPSLTYITGSNISGVSGTITNTALTVNVTVTSTVGADQFTISGLQVQPLTTSAPAGNIYAASVSGIAGITTGTGGSNFASLAVVAPVTASVSIAASPAGAICPGTNVVFTPTPVNAGTPNYTWSLNGVDVSIGSSYSNSSLLNGNTVSCRMTSSLGCLTGNPVHANTITATVLIPPAAITGSNNVCPGNTVTLGNTTTGGVWSSTNPAVGTISGSGVVTGIVAGTTTISYTVGGCAATRTVFVNNHPFAPALSSTSAAICNGSTLPITATGSPASPNILSQNFNSGLGGWVVDTIGSINILPGAEWKACADSYLNEQGWYRSPDHTTFMMANADTSGSSSTLSTRLTSPMFSLAEYTAATLTFQHAYDYWPAGDVYVNLEISTNGGSSWTTINNFRGANAGTKMGFVGQSFSLNPFLGYPNVKIRFHYHSSFGYYWALDNVIVTGTPGYIAPTWSPATWLYTDAACTIPYVAGNQSATVYVHPTAVSSSTPITYTATSTSGACAGAANSTVTVNPAPGAMSGALNVCVGTSSTLSNSVAGGTWVSGNTAIATIGSASGVVNGLSAGTAAMTYMLGSTCTAVVVVTVNISPAAITGNTNVCLGYSSTLANATTGGGWTSGDPAIAPVNATTGEVYGLALGTANITYSLGAGCIATSMVTVQPLPAAISGPAAVCATHSVTLTNATGGGTWAGSNSSIATVGSASGVVSGIVGGTANISYILTSTGCFAVKNVQVNPEAPITGPTRVCAGAAITLANSETGGTWTSGNTIVATVDPASGTVTGASSGTTSITYILPTGCVSSRDLTVDPLPAGITGPASVCIGSNITLGNTTAPGSWSGSNAAVATIGTSSGIVTGMGAGTAIMTYTTPLGCYRTYTINVLPVPAAITGTAAVCEAGTTVLSCATTGGTWSSSNGNATVTNGTVSGITAGPVTITYTIPNGCYAIRSATVNPLPGAITGTMAVCQGLSSTLINSATGGSWTSSNTVIATIGSASGTMTGGAAGTSVITYTLPTGCLATAVMTTNTLPGTLTGPSIVCTGASVALTSVTTGGTWTSSNANASVAGGTVTGATAGSVAITYTLPTTCMAVKTMTVYTSPAAIGGTPSVCEGLTTLLTCATTGGAWSTGNASVADVPPYSGLVTGMAAGTTNITYMLVTGCTAIATVTVMPLPAAITGTTNVCPGTSATLSSITTGGTWVSSVSANVSVGSASGIITGGVAGTSVISYILPTGCYTTTYAVTNPLPAGIVGSSSVCVGSGATYTNVTGGGSWATSNAAIGTIGSTTGIFTGIANGTVVISYILPTGCAAVRTISVNPLPDAITGPDNICQGATVTYTNATPGGTWTSGVITVASVGSSSGDVFGVSGGMAPITYTLPTGCRSVFILSVTATPAAISGSASVCVGSSILLSSATPGGSWVSGAPAIGSVNTGGIVSGVSAGTTLISYVLPLGCRVTKLVSVNPLPAAIVGNTSLCIGTPSTLSNATPGGIWTSATPTIASVGTSTGTVNGLLVNTTTISYILPTGCFTTTMVTVNVTPAAVTGASGLCEGQSTIYNNGVSGGTWSSSNASVASVGASTGVVSAISAGTATISYTLYGGCSATRVINIFPIPAPIDGATNICVGQLVTMTDVTPGGTWSSTNISVASIGSSSGVVMGLATGTAKIIYMLPAGCVASVTITVNSLPAPLTGSAVACIGSTTVLSTLSTGGSWSSGDPAIATVTGGVVSGIALGTAVISYSYGGGGCFVTKVVTVNPLPPPITGPASTCPGLSIALSIGVSGGAWSSTTSPGVATVNPATGVVNPISAGTAVITYTHSTGCRAYTTVTVTTVPAIVGPSVMCMGTATAFSHPNTGGTWGSSNTLIVGINASSGLAVGFSANTATISYTLPGGCVAKQAVTINTAPAAIGGATSVCPGLTTLLTNTIPGGTWSSSNTANATIGSSSGIVSGIATGVVSISYTLPTGCATSKLFTVNAAPATITGPATVCATSNIALGIAATGGTWISGTPSIASVGPTTGIVTGVTAGTVTISYQPAVGCVSTTVLTVHSVPAAITGTGIVCSGNTTTLANTTAGGTWSSNNTAIATVGSATGVVNTLTAGTATISYTLPAGCAATSTITVNQTPSVISGIPSVCVGYNTTLTSLPGGGTWTSTTPAVAAVPTGSGLVSGIATGTSIITYRLANSCRRTTIVTVSASPSVIPPATVCLGATATLTDPASAGGTWSSGNISIATIGSLSGVVAGINTGTTTITYTIGTGCVSTTTVTTQPVPAAITGLPNTCLGMITTLNTTTTGGTWSSSNSSVAVVGTGNGVVFGAAPGTADISYILPTGCSAVRTVTVSLAPATISGSAQVCAGSTIVLTNSVAGGSWSSSNTAIGTVNAVSGQVTGIAAGTTDITYTLGIGCIATKTITVYPLPAAITGTAAVCTGLTTILSNSTPGGSWSTGGAAYIGTTSGIVVGVSPGTAVVSYMLGTGCMSTTIMTVHPMAANTGTATACVGFTTTLSNTVGGGTWVSANNAVATAGSVTGIITGAAPGTAVISYTLPTGCVSTTVVTIAAISAITGPTNICTGLTTTLGNAAPGGTWSTSAPAIATVSGGAVTGIAPGTATISYIYGTGCVASVVATVNPLSGIAGSGTVCMGQTIALSNAITGGTWSTTGPCASVDATTGVVTGISAGTTDISYLLPTGCRATKTITVNALYPITGPTNLCVGLSMTLSNAATGGTWSSTNPGVATITSASGIVVGLSLGTTTISYIRSTGCNTAFVVSVTPMPAAITGQPHVCIGATTTLANASTGGTWVSSDITVLTIGSASGMVTGLSAGAATVSYRLTSGCFATTTFTVNALPPAISGVLQVCAGSATALGNAIAGGTWSGGNASIATVAAGTGIVSGVAQGTAAVTYTAGTGCATSAIVTVQPLPATISGSGSVCSGATTTLASATPGGTWSAASPTAGVDITTGVVTGISAGTAAITYTLPTGCYRTHSITVYVPPTGITGPSQVCAGSSILLANATSGGTWASGSTGTATINSTGLVSGIAAGTSTITYSLTSGCNALYTVTVHPLPTPMAGGMNVCIGSATTLASAPTGGTWASSAPLVATVSGGVVSGISAGTTVISYTLPTGCFIASTVTVNTLPATITGVFKVCTEHTTTLASTTTGGTWSSLEPTVATVNATTGVVSGIATGTATIVHTLATGCSRSAVVTVNLTPAAINGLSNVCEGATTPLTSATPGGVWSSATPAIATIGSSSGIVTGITAGSAVISYSLAATGCYTRATLTVDPVPAGITGITSLCPGTGTTLGNTIPGGTWSASGAAISLDALTGEVTGVTTGYGVVTYTVNGCFAIGVIPVNPLPAPVTGPATVCQAGLITLSNTTASGVWVSGTPAIATVHPATGVVSGLSAGVAAISYRLPTGCATALPVTVNALPAAIVGATSACLGTPMPLTSAPIGGTWTSGNITIATVGSATGMVTGVTIGATTATYTLPTGCRTVATIVVHPLPSPVSGPSTICQDMSVPYFSPTPDGVWSSSLPAVAGVNSVSGTVTGVSAGTATISYTLATGCSAVSVVTVNALLPITGLDRFCVGDTSVYGNGIPGGVWSSNTPVVATISATGTAHGLVYGATIISYSLPSGCVATRAVTVDQLPATYVLTGGGTFCAGAPGAPITLVGSTPGINYRLYNGTSPVFALIGTGGALNYGLHTTGGTYSIIATNPATGCSRAMTGTALIDPIPVLPAAISISSPVGDTMCFGSSALFSAITAMGGSAPAYQWSVNGTVVSTASSYAYTPADGDVLSCKLTSSSACATPAVATAYMNMTVLPIVAPGVSIAATPTGKVCAGTPVSFIATPVNGGITPAYQWRVNGSVAGTSSAYSYTPAHNDLVQCFMASGMRCRSADTVASSIITTDVAPLLIPQVTVSATPGFDVLPGTTITFSAAATNTGAAPAYQWKISGSAITGATNTTFTWSTFAGGDVVSCAVTSSGECAGYTSADSGTVTFGTAVHTNAASAGIGLYPNPNKGNFILKGRLGAGAGYTLQVTDVLGQVVYTGAGTAANGALHTQVTMPGHLANGMYMLSLLSDDGQRYILHFVIER